MRCSECKYWEPGEYWQSPNGKGHGCLIDCKGFCTAKPNKRKRWNYASAYNCNFFTKSERNSYIMYGNGVPTQEQLNRLIDFIDEKLN